MVFGPLKQCILLTLQREGKGEREGEIYQSDASHTPPPTGDLAHNPGMCPDWEPN